MVLWAPLVWFRDVNDVRSIRPLPPHVVLGFLLACLDAGPCDLHPPMQVKLGMQAGAGLPANLRHFTCKNYIADICRRLQFLCRLKRQHLLLPAANPQ